MQDFCKFISKQNTIAFCLDMILFVMHFNTVQNLIVKYNLCFHPWNFTQ